MKQMWWMVTALGLAAGHLLGNAGGYYRGGVANAGDVQGFEPQATGNIRMLDEKLPQVR